MDSRKNRLPVSRGFLPLVVSQTWKKLLLRSWQAGLLLFLLQTAVVGLVDGQNEPISCLVGRGRCHADKGCQTLLDSMHRYCDETIFTCTSIHKARCHAALSSLQVSVHFSSCTCDPLVPDAVACIELQKRIFLHACVTNDVTHPNITWIVPKPGSKRHRSQADLDISDIHEGHISCIGVRKSCLLDVTCNEILREFRETCRENKKQGVCVSTEKQRCFNALEDLLSITPEIFDCTCHMRRPETLQKCLHIQSRLANNTCRVSVPYFIHSTRQKDVTYNDVVTMVGTMADPDLQDTRSTCVRAFMRCNYDLSCRVRMAQFMSTCTWDKSGNTCKRQECLDAIKMFYLLVRPEHAHSLLFCRCRDEDTHCNVIRQAMFPTCAVVEEPPPSCIDIFDRCQTDSDCRVRWQSYEQHCNFDLRVNGCPGLLAQCRVAQAGIMGTILTTNCTCVHHDENTNQKCFEYRTRLQSRNMCKELAIRDFHRKSPVVPPGALWADEIVAAERSDCQRKLAQRIPIFMNVPAVIRRYQNDSDCSEVCECHHNGSLVCIKLPCAAKLSCKYRSETHEHGTSFNGEERGQCRCIKSEPVCAKGTQQIVPKEGLFLHVGFSLADQYLVEGNSAVLFNPKPVSDKLGALMNGDSAEQFCRLDPYDDFDGNIVFEITVAETNTRGDEKGVCIDPAKMISYMINNRQPPILADAMLSILKVSQLERIEFHQPAGYESTDNHASYHPQVSILLTMLCILVSL